MNVILINRKSGSNGRPTSLAAKVQTSPEKRNKRQERGAEMQGLSWRSGSEELKKKKAKQERRKQRRTAKGKRSKNSKRGKLLATLLKDVEERERP